MSGPRGASREQKISDWLQYFDDLGIREFFRERTWTAARLEQSLVAGESARNQPDALSSSPSASSLPPRPVFTGRITTNVAPSTEEFVPIERSASLFEAAGQPSDDTLEKIREDIGDCTRCKLCGQRTNIVFGVGNPKAELVFVGEGPGRDEDIQGEPFVGRAGQLLTQMIEAMGLKRSDVYICNVVKCRPPENRLPGKDEIEICSPFLLRQLAAIKPKIIVALGSCAVQTLLQTKRGITGLRGQFFPFQGAKLMATYHPAYLLRNPPAKPDVWKDLQLVMKELGLKPPAKSVASNR